MAPPADIASIKRDIDMLTTEQRDALAEHLHQAAVLLPAGSELTEWLIRLSSVADGDMETALA